MGVETDTQEGVEGLLRKFKETNSRITDLQRKNETGKVALDTLTRKKQDLERAIKDALINGDSLSNPILNYCVYHYGAEEVDSNINGMNIFLDELKKYAENNELILINREGYSWTSSRLDALTGKMKGRHERVITFGILQERGYIITRNMRLESTTKDLKVIVDKGSSTWMNSSSPLYLDKFLSEMLSRQSEQISRLKIGISTPSSELHPGLLDPNSGMRVGATHTKYDSQPYELLLVGTEAVKEYLSTQEFTRKERFIPDIPK